jgi:hypothetical protein
MRNAMKAVLVLIGLALVLGSAPISYAAQPTFLDLSDDGIPAGQRDKYEAVCNGKGNINATVTGNGTDTFTVSIVCTSGVESKGNSNSDTGTNPSATVGDKCTRVLIDVICSNGNPCPGGDCSAYTVRADCLTNPISRFELLADDVP